MIVPPYADFIGFVKSPSYQSFITSGLRFANNIFFTPQIFDTAAFPYKLEPVKKTQQWSTVNKAMRVKLRRFEGNAIGAALMQESDLQNIFRKTHDAIYKQL